MANHRTGQANMRFRSLRLASILLCVATGALAQSAPPDRVGRIAGVTGAVSFHPAGNGEWQPARINLPVTTGTGLWVPPGGEAAIGVADQRIVLAPSTEFELDRLDDQALEATQGQGESYVHLRQAPAGETYVIRTPRGAATLAAPGRYGVVSGDTEHPTTITVLDGAATLSGGPSPTEIPAGQTLTVTGDGTTAPFTGVLGPAAPDAFLQHALAEEAPPRPRPPLAPAIVAQMTGSAALLDTGEWAETPEYGPVWYPPVATYVPYRAGRWAFVAPWGWTWVDDAPWGFTPSHYGRWARFDGRWGWVPGRDWAPDRPPVYAPALVAFVGGAALGVGSGKLIGWTPLGPREPYRPTYTTDTRVLQALNRPTGAPLEGGGRPFTIDRSLVTVVQPSVLTSSAPVGAALQPRGPTIRAAAAQFQPPIAPTRATMGATRAGLQQGRPAGLPASAPPPAGRPASAGVPPGALLGAMAGGGPHPPAAGLPALRQREAPPPGFRPAVAGAPPIARPASPTPPRDAAPPRAVSMPRPEGMPHPEPGPRQEIRPGAPPRVEPPRSFERPEPRRDAGPPMGRQQPMPAGHAGPPTMRPVAQPHPPAAPQPHPPAGPQPPHHEGGGGGGGHERREH